MSDLINTKHERYIFSTTTYDENLGSFMHQCFRSCSVEVPQFISYDQNASLVAWNVWLFVKTQTCPSAEALER